MSTNGLVLISALLQKISTGDKEGVLKYLNLLPINNINQDKINSLLARFLTTAQEFNQGVMVKVIYEFFNNQYIDKYQLPLLNQIIADQKYEDETIAFILKQFPEKSYLLLAKEYINYKPDENIMDGLRRLEAIKGPLSIKEYQELFDLSIAEDNYITTEFLKEILDNNSPYASIPEWVKNFTELEEIPFEDELVIPEEKLEIRQVPNDTEEIVEILTEGLKAMGKANEEKELAEMELRKKLSGSSQEEKMNMVRGVLNNKAKRNLANDEEIFAILGPVNAILDDDLVSNKDICHQYGGCRMLCCIEFEDILDSSNGQIVYNLKEYRNDEWFKGACQICHLRIRRPCHAIRMPLDHGGWKGCYCSEKCLRRDLENNEVLTILVDQLMEDIKRIGIQDRLPVETK